MITASSMMRPASPPSSAAAYGTALPAPKLAGKSGIELRKAAEVLVAHAFFKPMLEQMRNSPWKDEMLSGGRGGQAFASMLDQRLAERAATGSGGAIVTSIVRKYGKAAEAAQKLRTEEQGRIG
jgi:Rod binding domain-containing protein